MIIIINRLAYCYIRARHLSASAVSANAGGGAPPPVLSANGFLTGDAPTELEPPSVPPFGGARLGGR